LKVWIKPLVNTDLKEAADVLTTSIPTESAVGKASDEHSNLLLLKNLLENLVGTSWKMLLLQEMTMHV